VPASRVFVTAAALVAAVCAGAALSSWVGGSTLWYAPLAGLAVSPIALAAAVVDARTRRGGSP
jgi:hypothetical protein